eukprot:GFUD01138578.1.p1 GENE.GFUD01138578.1~~GFUD01138578.1.p1  ORF type:complete len:623 (-),score=105.53 GFUD01138578.1:90-1769(-)
MASDLMEVCIEARKGSLGPFSPSFDANKWIRETLDKLLPDDIHLKVNGRLHISLTKVYDGKNLLVTEFSSKEEIIEVVVASSFIPLFSGMFPPKYRGIRVMDGGYTDNLPILDEQTITVSPFCGSADICPQDEYLNHALTIGVANFTMELSKENLFRMSSVLFPPKPEVLAGLCKQGFDDALRFLEQRALISCTRCMAVDSSYGIEEEMDEPHLVCAEFDPNCPDCVLHKEEAMESTVPETITEVFDKASGKMETGYIQWISDNRMSKMIFYPVKIIYRSLKFIIFNLIRLTVNLKIESFMFKLMDPIFTLLLGDGYNSQPRSHFARYTCEFNITQYGEDSDDLIKLTNAERRESVKDLLNLCFVAQLEGGMASLPLSHEAAIKFQNENLSAAISPSSRIHSRRVSLAPPQAASRRDSLIPASLSRASLIPTSLSSAVSRRESRVNTSNNLCELVGEVPSTFDNLKEVTDTKDAVMSFYYKDSSSQVKLMEIFDVTKTDPSLLVTDEVETDYYLDSANLRSSLESARFRQLSGSLQSSFRRRHSSAPQATFSIHSEEQT